MTRVKLWFILDSVTEIAGLYDKLDDKPVKNRRLIPSCRTIDIDTCNIEKERIYTHTLFKTIDKGLKWRAPGPPFC